MRLLPRGPVLAVLALSSLAQAKVVYRSANWALDDLSDAINPNANCVMQTQAIIGKNVWQLEISHAKGLPGVTEIMIRQTASAQSSAGTWSTTTAAGGNFVFAPAGKSADGKSTLTWLVPQDTQALLAQFEANKDLPIKAADGASRTSYRFYNVGYTAVKAEMLKRCLAPGATLVDTAFEKAFLKPQASPINPNGLAAETVTELRSLLTEAFKVRQDIGANSAAFRALQTQYQAPLALAQTLSGTITQLTQTDIPGLQAQQQQNEALEASSKQELARLTALIPSQETALKSAADLKDRTYNVIQPYLNDHENLSDAVDASSSAVQSYSGRLSQIDSSLSSLNAQLRNLTSELSTQQSNLRSAQSEASSADSQYSSAYSDQQRAQRDFDAFDPNYEMRRRLQSDWSYSSAVSNLESARRDAQRAQEEWKRAVADRDAKERAVQSCQATPGADCSSQQSEWKVAVAVAERAESNYRPLESRISSLESDVRRAQDNVAYQVNQIRGELGRRLSDANSRLNGAQRRRDAADRQVQAISQRISSIQGYELPNTQNQISSLDSERPQVSAQLAGAQAQLSTAQRNLASFEQRVGWDAKLAAYNSADSAWRARTRELNASRSGVATAQSNIQSAQTLRPQLAQALADKQALLAQTQAQLVDVRQQLAPYEAEAARLQGQGQSLQASFDGLSVQFDSKLPH